MISFRSLFRVSKGDRRSLFTCSVWIGNVMIINYVAEVMLGTAAILMRSFRFLSPKSQRSQAKQSIIFLFKQYAAQYK